MRIETRQSGAHPLPTACGAVSAKRLLDTAVRLIARPSPTGAAGAAADELAAILAEDGFAVERRAPRGPGGRRAAHVRSPRPHSSVQRPPRHRSSAVRAARGFRRSTHREWLGRHERRHRGGGRSDAGGLSGGEILLTSHDLHENPWGDGSQLDALVADGFFGNAVLIPEYFNAALPVIGRGGFTWSATVRRPGPPIHEVNRPNEPSVIATGAELVARLGRLDAEFSRESHPLAGAASAFIGTIQSGSIYNEFPQTCRLEGTRRWLPGTRFADAERQFRTLCADLATETGTTIGVETRLMRDAFRLDVSDPFVGVFQSAYSTLVGEKLPIGGKPFVDDGNSFWSGAGVPAITHGPTAGGAHTTAEWANVDDLVRVARLYALTAIMYCPGNNA